ncbi:MAG: ATP-binding cassette domain-containing protein, partial [Rickettsiales bacterium]|nr:ATP-binding cassette domain-containing protein [Rickettsiales bacterium]
MTKSKSTLKLERIKKSYNRRPILKGITMDVSQGEVVGLLGPNGAGKTTCFYCVTGLVIPNGGKIFMDDYDITSLPFYKRAQMGIGYLPQENSVFRGLSVWDNIMAILEAVEPVKQKRIKKCEELLA